MITSGCASTLASILIGMVDVIVDKKVSRARFEEMFDHVRTLLQDADGGLDTISALIYVSVHNVEPDTHRHGKSYVCWKAIPKSVLTCSSKRTNTQNRKQTHAINYKTKRPTYK